MEGRARSVLFTPVGSFWDAFITSAVYFTGGNEEKRIHTLLASPAVWDSEIGHTVEWIGGASLGGHEAAAIDTELRSSQCVYCASFLRRAFPSFLSLPPLFSFPSFPPPLGFSLLCVPVAPASPTPTHSLHSFQPLSASYTEKKEIGTAVNLRDPSQGQSEFWMPWSCLPSLGGRNSGQHPREGASGGRISWFHQEGEFLACEARRQTSLTFIFVPLLCYQFFISKENNITVHPSPLYNNSFSKMIAVLLPIISFWRQLRLSVSFCVCFQFPLSSPYGPLRRCSEMKTSLEVTRLCVIGPPSQYTGSYSCMSFSLLGIALKIMYYSIQHLHSS